MLVACAGGGAATSPLGATRPEAERSATHAVAPPVAGDGGVEQLASHALPPIDPARGRIVVAAKFSDHDKSRDCLHFGRGFTDLAVTAEGHVWLVGSCGVRVRFDGKRFEAFDLKPRHMRLFGGSCLAHLHHWRIWGQNARHAFLLSTPRCGPDPNAVWSNGLERFDGRRWRQVPMRLGFSPHDTDLFVIAGAPDGSVWLLAQGDDWHGTPRDVVIRHATTPSILREGVSADVSRPPARADQTFRLERYSVLAPVSRDEAWVFGTRSEIGPGATDAAQMPRGASWHYANSGFAEHALETDEVKDAWAAEDGSIWVVGPDLWRWDGGSFRRLPLGLDPQRTPLVSVWARSQADVWLLAEHDEPPFSYLVLNFAGHTLRRIEIQAEMPDPDSGGHTARIRGAGDHVWLVVRDHAWRLAPPDA
jgi:hypothetical protein